MAPKVIPGPDNHLTNFRCVARRAPRPHGPVTTVYELETIMASPERF